MNATETKVEWYAKPTAGHDIHGQSAIHDEYGKDIAIVYDGEANADGPDHVRPDLHRDRIATLERLFDWVNGPRHAAIAKATT